MKKSVLVLGDHQQTIAVVRSLAASGWRVIVGCHGRRPFASLSRHACGTWSHPEPDSAAFASALHAFLAEHPEVRCIFPVGEDEIQALVACEGLPAYVQRAMPSADAVHACLDKPRSFRIAQELGIPQVSTVVVTTHRELLDAASQIGLPLAIKCPDSSRLINGRKAAACISDAQLSAFAGARYPLIVQRWFCGTRHNCQFIARDGELVAYFQQAVVRTDEADGTGFGIEGVSVEPSAELAGYCRALCRRLNYHGAGCAQFLVDDDGDCVFLELNPRLDATCELALRCGIDLPRLAVDPALATLSAYPIGRRFHWLLGDLRSLGHRIKSADLGRHALSAYIRQLGAAHWRAHHRLTWHWLDPLPTLYLYGHAVIVGGRSYVHAAGVAARHHG
ncbi:MAG: ATP-grasp domain-containing protein [Xanthomonadaceae bacterium]|nr:ATP-grasp domain-containing protein [Xanthomonadaceae bacterium]